MMALRTLVTINDDTIAQLFLPGLHGDGWWWMRKVGNQHKQLAEIIAPKRTGHMAAQHKLFLTPNGKYQVRYTVGNTADYAHFVHEGTKGPIHSNRTTIAEINADAARGSTFNTPHMVVRAAPHSHFLGPTAVLWVEGQKAQPWLVDAAEIIWQQYG